MRVNQAHAVLLKVVIEAGTGIGTIADQVFWLSLQHALASWVRMSRGTSR